LNRPWNSGIPVLPQRFPTIAARGPRQPVNVGEEQRFNLRPVPRRFDNARFGALQSGGFLAALDEHLSQSDFERVGWEVHKF
jgi:hypothetical protein